VIVYGIHLTTNTCSRTEQDSCGLIVFITRCQSISPMAQVIQSIDPPTKKNINHNCLATNLNQDNDNDFRKWFQPRSSVSTNQIYNNID